MADLVNRFLNAKRVMVESGELSPRTFRDYHSGCAEIIEHFGRTRAIDDCRPEDFAEFRAKASQGRGLHAISRIVTLTRMVFGFAYDSELVDKPIRFGQLFVRPSKKSMRQDRAKKQAAHGLKMFEAEEIRKMLESASVPLKAMILLAVNGGLGNSDLSSLPKSAIQDGWIVFPRVKTGIDRRIPLWPETIEALNAAIAKRPNPKDEADGHLVFITKYGSRWVRLGKPDPDKLDGKKDAEDKPDDKPDGKPKTSSNIDKIADAFKKLQADLEQRRHRIGFYALRHTFETIGGGCGDQVAVSAIMGHVDDSMASLYRERIEDSRLRAAVDHVRAWLFPATAKKTPAKKTRKQAKKSKAE